MGDKQFTTNKEGYISTSEVYVVSHCLYVAPGTQKGDLTQTKHKWHHQEGGHYSQLFELTHPYT